MFVGSLVFTELPFHVIMCTMLIDTHCHLHDLEWFTPEQRAEFLQDAHTNDVKKIVCIGTNHADSLKARDFAAKHPGVYWTYGIHPEYATDDQDALRFSELVFLDSSSNGVGDEIRFGELELRSFQESPEDRMGNELRFSESGLSAFSGISATNEERTKRPEPRNDGREEACPEKHDNTDSQRQTPPIAIGEIGLDYHYDGYDRSAQIKLFEQMLQLAQDTNLPVSLHLRAAFADAFAVLDNFPKTRGVVHSFTGSKKDLKKALERGFYIGVNGLVTYTTPPLPPLDRILLETDAPFLTPVPFRGTINKPGYVKQIAAYLATKLGVTELNIAEQTTKNAQQLFKI